MMATVEEWAESRGWVEPHWERYHERVIKIPLDDDGDEYVARCECDWWSKYYANDPTGACRALWAHHLNPEHTRITKNR